MKLNDNLVKLIQRVRLAIERGDMLVGSQDEFPGDLALAARVLGLNIGIFDGRVLLKLPRYKAAVTRNGSDVKVVSYYNGVYYDREGRRYREKDLAWQNEETV